MMLNLMVHVEHFFSYVGIERESMKLFLFFEKKPLNELKLFSMLIHAL